MTLVCVANINLSISLEGHCIRNHESQVSIAVRSLTSEFKWILTGTPFVKSVVIPSQNVVDTLTLTILFLKRYERSMGIFEFSRSHEWSRF